MLVNDLIDVVPVHIGVPHGFRVDYDHRPAFAAVEAAGLVDAQGHLVTLPFRDGLDAFFAAVFVRRRSA